MGEQQSSPSPRSDESAAPAPPRRRIYAPSLSIVGTPLEVSVFHDETSIIPAIDVSALADSYPDLPQENSSGQRPRNTRRRVRATRPTPVAFLDLEAIDGLPSPAAASPTARGIAGADLAAGNTESAKDGSGPGNLPQDALPADVLPNAASLTPSATTANPVAACENPSPPRRISATASTMPPPAQQIADHAPQISSEAGNGSMPSQPAISTQSPSSSPRPASVTGSTLAMASGTLVSRLLGFVRNATLTAAIGTTTIAANAFDVANNLPNFIYAILAGGIFNAILVPQIVRAYKRGMRMGDEFVNRLFTVGFIALAVLTALLTIGATVLVSIYTHGWTHQQTALAVTFAYWCIPEIFFYGMYMLLGQVLNARERFAAFMWAPVLNNVVSIAGFIAFIVLFGRNSGGAWGHERVVLLAGTATFGIVVQALVLFIPLSRIGFHFHPRWGLRGWGLGETARLAGWTFGAMLADQGALWVAYKLASYAQVKAGSAQHVAANAALTQGLMIYIIPHSLITVSLVTALFTRMSAAAANGDIKTVRNDFSFGLRTTAAFTMFFTAVLIVLALPITRVLIPAVPAGDVQSIARVLVPLSIGLIPTGMTLLIMRVFYAFGHASTIFWIQLPMALVYIGAALVAVWLLPVAWWVVGIGAAQTLSYIGGVSLRLRSLRRLLHGLDGVRILSVFARLTLAALLAGGIGWLLLHAIPHLGSWSIAYGLVACLGVGIVMAILYLGLLKIMRVRELAEFFTPLLGRLRRRKANPV